MRSLVRKLTALLLALLMLLPLTACATGENTDESHTVSTEAATESITEDPNYVCDLPEKLNYNTEVNYLYTEGFSRGGELFSKELDGSVISDAVYERNVKVEDRLGVKLGFTGSEHDTVTASTIDRLVKAGDTSYDIVSIGTYVCMTPVLAGNYLDLNAVDNMDLSKHYWNQDYNEMMTFTSDKLQFVATSPTAISIFRAGYLTIFNRDLFLDHKIPDLYEAVEKGEWTLDYQYSIIKDVYVDNNGDSKANLGDFYGFVVGDVTDMDVYAVSSDIHLIVRDENGDLHYDAESFERLVTMSEKVSALCHAPGTYLAKSYSEGFQIPIEQFIEYKTLMATTMFIDMENYLEYLAEINYGIAPLPKLNKEQKEYGTYIQDSFSAFGISAAICDEDRQAVVGAVMEATSYYSYELVRPAYYESVMSLRFMNDPQSGIILDTMFESISFDFVYATGFGSIRDNLRPVISSSSPAIASQTKAWESKILSALRNQQRALERLQSAYS